MEGLPQSKSIHSDGNSTTTSLAGPSSSPSPRRRYRKIHRTGSRRSTGARIAKRERLLRRPPSWEECPTYSCCERNGCIKKVKLSSISAARAKIARYSDNERKEFLLSLLISDEPTGTKYFVFDQVRVCTSFLRAAFLYSPGTISAVKGNPLARTAPLNILSQLRPRSAPTREKVRFTFPYY